MKFSSLSNEVLSEILSFLCLKALIDPVSVVDRRFYYLAANLVANRKKGIEPHEITSLIIYFGLHDASQVSSGLRWKKIRLNFYSTFGGNFFVKY